ncbi:GMC family oxidoreductase [Mucilaginibacter sp.]|uniref:GMC family oxidoreductase n=1 Tax=Mucilaginibacter sp. TaxID=1882438 RepID=UPI0035BBDEA5
METINVKNGKPGQVDSKLNTNILAQYDYIIVGAGSAGCVIARRLLDATEANILLIEAGDSHTEIDQITDPLQWLSNIGTTHDYFYRYEPTAHINHRTIIAPRGKLLGGSGSINAMVWARGNKADYDGWAAAGNKGWDFDSVLPLFKKIEDWEFGETEFHGAGGPIHVETAKEMHRAANALIEAAVSYGIPYLKDTNGLNSEGVGPMSMNTLHGKRCSTFTGYLKPVMNSGNLTVLTNTKVTGLAIQDGQCKGVNFIHDEHYYHIGASSEVILTAGTIETPRILMLSGIGPAEDLSKIGILCSADLPGVGQNLQDHPLIAGLCFETDGPLGQPTHNLLGSALYAKSAQETKTADLMIIPAQGPLVTDEIGAKHKIPEYGFTLLPTLVKVKSRGFLKMETAQFDGPLVIQPNFLADQQDLEALTDAIELCLDLTAQPAFQTIIKNKVTPGRVKNRQDIKDFIRDACGTYFHPVGTCAMGSGAAAVVDNHLRVHGISGLRIADASVMPQITSGNTNAPTIMIAEFAANLILASAR